MNFSRESSIPKSISSDVVFPIYLEDPEIDTPAVFVDLDIVEGNLKRMAHFANESGLALRPHIKSHKSLYMANKQLEYGAIGLCVATASEAEVMGDLGDIDLLLAYPLVGKKKLKRVANLLKREILTLVADSSYTLRQYAGFAESEKIEIPLLIEVDTGMNRSGVVESDVVHLVKEIAQFPLLKFRGIMTHAGQTHDSKTFLDLQSVARNEARIMGDLREELERQGYSDLIVSAGSSLTSPYLRGADGITEIRPGTYIYNDLRTMNRWACSRDQIATFILSTVVSGNSDRITIDAGSKTLTTASIDASGYGEFKNDSSAQVSRLSEEHGVVDGQGKLAKYPIGSRVQVLPIHVCVWMDLQTEIYGIRDGKVTERIAIQAMRHSL